MTVSTTSIKNSYSGNGSTTAFAYTFKAFASSEIKVFIRTDSTGAEAQRSEGSGSTNYSVSGVGNAGGGTVTFVTAPASGETVVIRRQTAQTQGTDYVENDPFPAEDHETALDKLTHIVQEVQEEVDRSFKVSKTNSITTPEFVDDASTRASKLLGFSSDGNTLEATTGRVNTVSVSAVSAGGTPTASFNTTTGALALGVVTGNTGAQGPAGDLDDPTTTQGDIIVRGASAVERLAKGSNSTVLNTNASGALAYSTVSTAMIADDAVTYAKMQHTTTANRVLGAASAGTLGEVQVATDMIADDAVSLSKMASGTDGNLITYDSSGNPAHVATGSSGQVLTSNGAGAAPTFQAAGGKVVAYANTHVSTDASTTATFPDDDTAPGSSEGTEYTTFTHTASSATNKILIQVIAQAATNGVVVPVLALFKDSGSTAVRTVFEETHGNGPVMMTLQHLDTAGSTSTITYKLRFGSSGNTGTVYLGSQHHSGGRWNDTGGVNIQVWELEA